MDGRGKDGCLLRRAWDGRDNNNWRSHRAVGDSVDSLGCHGDNSVGDGGRDGLHSRGSRKSVDLSGETTLAWSAGDGDSRDSGGGGRWLRSGSVDDGVRDSVDLGGESALTRNGDSCDNGNNCGYGSGLMGLDRSKRNSRRHMRGGRNDGSDHGDGDGSPLSGEASLTRLSDGDNGGNRVGDSDGGRDRDSLDLSARAVLARNSDGCHENGRSGDVGLARGRDGGSNGDGLDVSAAAGITRHSHGGDMGNNSGESRKGSYRDES